MQDKNMDSTINGETVNEEFGKHYASMYEGSMVGAGAAVFAVMGYVIAKQRPRRADGPDGDLFVELNPRLLAAIFGKTTPQEIEKAIAFLCGGDPESRSKEEKGARLVREGQFLYRVVNGRKYRQLYSEVRRRDQNREAQQRFRDRAKERARIAAESAGRERRFVRADSAGDQAEADRISGEGL